MEEQNAPAKTSKKVRWLIIGAALLGILFIVFFYKRNVSSSFDSTLYFSAKAVNLTCPQQIDEVTRLDSVESKAGRRFFYYYTLTTLTKDSLDTETFRDAMEPRIIEAVKTDITLQSFRDNSVTMVYVWNDKNADSITSVVVTPVMYGGTPLGVDE